MHFPEFCELVKQRLIKPKEGTVGAPIYACSDRAQVKINWDFHWYLKRGQSWGLSPQPEIPDTFSLKHQSWATRGHTKWAAPHNWLLSWDCQKGSLLWGAGGAEHQKWFFLLYGQDTQQLKLYTHLRIILHTHSQWCYATIKWFDLS